MRILVTGATGFVGPAVVQRLVDDGHTVRVLEHSEGSSADLPSQEAVSGSMTDPASLREAAEEQDVVVHLVAILTGKPEEFRSVMEQGTRDLLEAARGAGVRRFVLMSALGTTEETKDLVPYYGAKWQMEQDVKASGLEYVIFRPSFVFGRDGGALGQFKKIAKLAPVTPIVGPGTQRIQPIWVDDVAAYFAAGVAEAGGREQDVRARRPRYGDVERVLVALEAGAGITPSEHAPAVRPDACAGDGAREAAEAAGDPRPAEDAGAGDNVVTNSDAVDTFGLPLVPLDEQLRRATTKDA